jgi:hypothetical protein
MVRGCRQDVDQYDPTATPDADIVGTAAQETVVVHGTAVCPSTFVSHAPRVTVTGHPSSVVAVR